MTEHPILFSAPMVRAILAGRKTQTRRVCISQPKILPIHTWIYDPDGHPRFAWCDSTTPIARYCVCPYGKPGDHLWVRETHDIVPATAYLASREDDGQMIPHAVSPDGTDWAIYRTGWTRSAPDRWRPSIHMPRWASRLTLELTAVRVERLQSISEQDAIAEGFSPYGETMGVRYEFADTWDSLNSKRGYSWESNPWVWVLEFRKL